MVIMVLGDPDYFSIFCETIKEWNVDGAYGNGILLFCLNGKLYPPEIVNATLKCEVWPLREKLRNIAQDEQMYSMEKEKAFIEMFNVTFPDFLEDESCNNDYRFEISPYALEDYHCFAFAVSNGKSVRILAAKLNYNKEVSRHELNNIEVNEVYISHEELEKIASGLEGF